LALLTPEQRKTFKFYTDRSPHLQEDEDKDVIIAKTLANQFGLNHEVRVHSSSKITDDTTFLRPPPAEILKLSGNHGGEILGGAVFEALEFYASKYRTNQFEKDYLKLTTLMFRSFFSDIYDGGVFNHWTMPFRFSARKCAPFWDERLIGLLAQLPPHWVNQYNLYSHIYRNFFSELIQIPFMSPIAQYNQDFQFMQRGINQKLVATKVSTKQLLNQERDLIREVGFFDYHDLENRDTLFISRALKVNRWISFFMKEQKWKKC